MNKTVADLAHRWLSRNSETLSDAERRVLQSALERRPVARDTNKKHSDTSSRWRPGRRRDRADRRLLDFIIGFLVFLVAWTATATPFCC